MARTLDLPWQVVETGATEEGATVRSALDSADHPETLEGYPFPYRGEATYRLDGQGLRLRFQVTNTGAGDLPFGFGAHPFFRAPLGERGAPGDCLVHIPAARRWNGRALQARLERGPAPARWDEVWDEVCPPVGEAFDLRTPKPFVEQVYNGAYTDLTLAGGRVEAFVRDPGSGVEAVMRATPNFGHVVFWSPPGRPEVCFEPWTCPPNVFNLAARGVPQHGLVTLAPGESWEGTMWIRLREVA